MYLQIDSYKAMEYNVVSVSLMGDDEESKKKKKKRKPGDDVEYDSLTSFYHGPHGDNE